MKSSFETGQEQLVKPGEYKVLDGNDGPTRVSFKDLVIRNNGSGPFSGIKNRGKYTDENGANHEIVSFLYHKLDANDQLEATERTIILKGFGYGEHPGHTGQPPSWYLIGPQIGTFDHETGEPAELIVNEDSSEIAAKHFSVACIVDGPLGDPILANPA